MSESKQSYYSSSSNGQITSSELIIPQQEGDDDSIVDNHHNMIEDEPTHKPAKTPPTATTTTSTSSQPVVTDVSITSDREWIDVLGNGLLRKKLVRPGDGASSRPSPQSKVTVRVFGFLKDGQLVDKYDSVKFYLADNDVIPAVDIVTSLMERGEICHVRTDAKYAYGTKGKPAIGRLSEVPPNTVLIYELELLEVAPPINILTITEENLIAILNTKRGRGNDLFQRKEYTQAVTSYGRAVKLTREYRRERDDSSAEINDIWIRCLNNLAAAQLKIDQLDDALSSAREVLSIDPNNVKALYRCGKVLLLKEEFDESVHLLQRACELSPDEKAISSELRKALQKQSQNKKTEKELYKRMLSSPQPPSRSPVSSSPLTTDNNNSTSQQQSSWAIGWKGLVIGAGLIAVLAIGTTALYSKYRK